MMDADDKICELEGEIERLEFELLGSVKPEDTRIDASGALARLIALKECDDLECSHSILLGLLGDLGYHEIVDAFDDLEKWYA